ncbi:hypothetical protein GOP47_0000655 [Adiantum capillus-veneris]|uniref:Uncharacterized protein n=1 Tax=Adiantum capillus-veneris TaxID=13818 RepID=A0A9D4VF52_ADICA|nr:hypothetical protein GOP47_0000655 [Adiantum capillus-veneris]
MIAGCSIHSYATKILTSRCALEAWSRALNKIEHTAKVLLQEAYNWVRKETGRTAATQLQATRPLHSWSRAFELNSKRGGCHSKRARGPCTCRAILRGRDDAAPKGVGAPHTVHFFDGHILGFAQKEVDKEAHTHPAKKRNMRGQVAKKYHKAIEVRTTGGSGCHWKQARGQCTCGAWRGHRHQLG